MLEVIEEAETTLIRMPPEAVTALAGVLKRDLAEVYLGLFDTEDGLKETSRSGYFTLQQSTVICVARNAD